jgi:tetratricopeptide (TPR) repeat protein
MKMGIYSNLIVAVIVPIIVVIPGSIALINDFREDKYNRHEQMTASYQGQIKSAEERGAKDEADSKRKEYEQYEEGWRSGQTINESSIRIIYLNPEGVPKHQQEKFSDALIAVANSPISTDTNTTSLGATYLGVEDYEKALESFDIVLSSDPDNTDARIFKADALVSIATTSPEYTDDTFALSDLIVEAGELITFDDLELSNMQDIYITKIETDINTLGMKIDGWTFGPAGD